MQRKRSRYIGDVVQDFLCRRTIQNMETYSELKPWGQRLNKIKKDGNHSDDFEKLNKPEVDRILKEIPDLQDKDQKWKDAFIEGLKSTFYGGE